MTSPPDRCAHCGLAPYQDGTPLHHLGCAALRPDARFAPAPELPAVLRVEEARTLGADAIAKVERFFASMPPAWARIFDDLQRLDPNGQRPHPADLARWHDDGGAC